MIAQIESSLFKAKVAQERANYDTAAAEREKAAVTVRDSERQLKRTRRLRRSKMASQSALDTARYKLAAFEAGCLAMDSEPPSSQSSPESVNRGWTDGSQLSVGAYPGTAGFSFPPSRCMRFCARAGRRAPWAGPA